MKKELLEGLTQEQLEKASRCKNEAELLELAKQEGVELTDSQLESVNGGACQSFKQTVQDTCPMCSALTTGEYEETTPGDGHYHFICKSCGYEWRSKRPTNKYQ